ncbi:MAG: metal-dependent hydrolase [Woeseiaceae bacterium]
MDSLTQAALGATIAGVCAPAGHRRKALLAGAALGTLPDLDVVIRYGDAVKNFTFHRGFSHSLFVLTPFSVALWALLRRWWAPVREAPLPWLAAISLALVTHPLLDAHTAYGTQLFWPLVSPPVMWSTLFIIDPLYTLPLLIGVIVAATGPAARRDGTVLLAGLVLSNTYLAWSWVGKIRVESDARLELVELGLADAPLFSGPTPFNTLLWRVVVLTEYGYLEGYDSLLVDNHPIRFEFYPSDNTSLEAASNVWAVARLRWFARDFLKTEVRGNLLVLTDLRMGAEPTYVFSHAVAEYGNPHWKAIPTELIPASLRRNDLDAFLRAFWQD